MKGLGEESPQRGRHRCRQEQKSRNDRSARYHNHVGGRHQRGYSKRRLFVGISWYELSAQGSRMVHDQDEISELVYRRRSEQLDALRVFCSRPDVLFVGISNLLLRRGRGNLKDRVFGLLEWEGGRT